MLGVALDGLAMIEAESDLSKVRQGVASVQSTLQELLELARRQPPPPDRERVPVPFPAARLHASATVARLAGPLILCNFIRSRGVDRRVNGASGFGCALIMLHTRRRMVANGFGYSLIVGRHIEIFRICKIHPPKARLGRKPFQNALSAASRELIVSLARGRRG